ncbi:placenta-specific protein 9 [Huso huso]|uniref:Placenta-specific protein 9 n=1 Tax=Huso huso TaxID=61971 RepID=A0ABR0ZRH2_HUSHU
MGLLLLLLRDQAAAGPGVGTLPRAVHGTACQQNSALHHRLDSVEKRVEEVVGQLETEVSILLDAIEAPEWSPLLEDEGPTIDILDNKDPFSRSSVCPWTGVQDEKTAPPGAN